MIEKRGTRCQLHKAPWTSLLLAESSSNSAEVHPEETSPDRTKKSNRRNAYICGEENSANCESFSLYDDAPRIAHRKSSRRRSSHSDTESVSDTVKMPVETTNSLLKSSFSLTSLRPCTASDSPDQGTCVPLKNERQYNSLTKQPRQRPHQLEKEMWRKSWGSVTGQDEKPFWEGFQADYDYLMSQNILEKDSEERCFATPTAPLGWSFSELNDQFAQLCSWLSGIQDSINSREENVTDWKLRAERQENLKRHKYRLENFNEESKRLIQRFPQLEGEISYYVRVANEMWENVESLTIGLKVNDGQRRKDEESRRRIKDEIRCLRKWMRELTTKLKPLSFQRSWTKQELEVMAKEHAVLDADIEARSYVVSSIVKLCERIDPSSLGAAKALQRKYCEYRLKSLEWKCYIENLQSNKTTATVIDSDGEPGAKKLKFDHDRQPSVNGPKKEVKTESDPPLKNVLREASAAVTMVGTNVQKASGNSKKAKSDRGSKLCHPAPETVPPPFQKAEESATKTTDPPAITNRKPNVATFNYEHLDTDQENLDPEKENHLERVSVEESEVKDVETTSSEDSWTYVNGKSGEKGSESSGDGKPRASVRLDFSDGCVSDKAGMPSSPTKFLSAKTVATTLCAARQNNIQELVDRADEMVRCRSTNSLEKNSRFKVRSRPGGDAMKSLESYDASSECTAEDSDDLDDGNVVTCRRSGSAEGILDDSHSPKAFGVVLRNSRHKNKARPSSMTCVPSCINQRISACGTQLSVSESALNQMSSKEYTFASVGKEKRTQWQEENGGSGSLRRPKRIRPRKRSILNRRGDNCLPVGALPSDPQQRSSPSKQITNLRGLVKSGSFSGSTPKQLDHANGQSRCSDSRSGTETDDDMNRPTLPVFKLGPEGGQVTVANERSKMQGDEPLSLNSDQVDWDNFQEKYQSEAYSEDPPDPDLVKKVLEFGEDYRKYIDSQSECEESKKIFRQKQEELSSWEGTLHSPEVISPSFSDETIVSSDKFFHCSDLLDDGDFIFCDQLGIVEGLLGIGSKIDPSKGAQLKEEMTLLRNELRRLASMVDEMKTTVTTRVELDTKIERIRSELDAVRKVKFKLRQINCSVHRLKCDTGLPSFALKDDVADLYQMWNKTFEKLSSKLCALQRISESWREFEELFAQFQCTLRSDQETLKTLDFALCDASRGDVLSVRDAARMLFDKETSGKSQCAFDGAAKPEGGPQQPVLASLTTEGSLSDSGISDSGSEQEMSERERKLARLKRLQKDLDGILAPGSPELTDMTQRMERAELELRRLQKTCRDLFTRTTTSAVGAEGSDLGLVVDPRTLSPLPGNVLAPMAEDSSGLRGTRDPDDDPLPGKSWFWRVVRAALPFHLALVALICVACLLEPHCCDAINSLGSTFAHLRYNRNPPPT